MKDNDKMLAYEKHTVVQDVCYSQRLAKMKVIQRKINIFKPYLQKISKYVKKNCQRGIEHAQIHLCHQTLIIQDSSQDEPIIDSKIRQSNQYGRFNKEIIFEISELLKISYNQIEISQWGGDRKSIVVKIKW